MSSPLNERSTGSAPSGPGQVGLNLQNFNDLEIQIEELFDQADELMINQKKYEEANQIFKKILNLDPDNVDALNS